MLSMSDAVLDQTAARPATTAETIETAATKKAMRVARRSTRCGPPIRQDAAPANTAASAG